MRVRKGGGGVQASVRRGDGAENLASASVVKVDLVGLLEGGELSAGFGDGEGWFCHCCLVEGEIRLYVTLTLMLEWWFVEGGNYELSIYLIYGIRWAIGLAQG